MPLADQFIYTPGYQASLQGGLASPNHYDYGQVNNRLADIGSQFNSQFKNLVGRDPTADEASSFFQQVVHPNSWEYQDVNSQQSQLLGQKVNDFVNQNFQQAAKDVATQKLEGQQQQAMGLADTFRKQGNASIDSVQNSLLDYQQKLFARLRPQLLTSLQNQGLLNTGGLNEAEAGVQGDLANAAQGSLLDARMQNENAANQIAFGGQSAPYYYNQAQIQNTVPYMQQQGQNASNNAFSNYMQNQQFSNQMALLNRQGQIQSDMQPSMLSGLGHSFVNSFGGQAGQIAPSFLNMSGGLGGAQKQTPSGAALAGLV